MKALKIALRTTHIMGLLAVGLLLNTGAAEAGALLCPGALGTGITRQLELEWTGPGTVECAAYGAGNLPTTDPYFYDPISVPGDTQIAFDLIQKDISPLNVGGNVTPGGNGTSGTFTINLPAGEYLLGFKFGGGSGDPDWFIFYLNGVQTGDWSFATGRGNGLSHMNLWGDPGNNAQVPEPASLALFGLGLAGVANYARRRKSA